MKKTLTHYQILEVSESASPEIIHLAWKALMQRYHPDKEGGDEGAARAINGAYDVLKDAERRALYDASLREQRRPVEIPQTQSEPAYQQAYPSAYPGLRFNPESLAETFIRNLNVQDAVSNAAEAVIEELARDNPLLRTLFRNRQRRRAG